MKKKKQVRVIYSNKNYKLILLNHYV